MGHRGRERLRERGGGGVGVGRERKRRRRRNEYNVLTDQSNAQSFVDNHKGLVQDIYLSLYYPMYLNMYTHQCVLHSVIDLYHLPSVTQTLYLCVMINVSVCL